MIYPRLVLENICKTYPAALAGKRHSVRAALRGVSVELGPGLYGLLGPNGAGKSTLISIITGGLEADSGDVLWNDLPARGIRFRRILGYVPQQQGLYDSYTGRRFLLYMAALKEIPGPRRQKRWSAPLPQSILPTSWTSGWGPIPAA